MTGKRLPLEERFWAKVAIAGADDCWAWTASVNHKGYGRIAVGGPRTPRLAAHRYSYELHAGPIPQGMFVCHRCDNPPCVNPAHLFLGTPADNSADMLAKGRCRSHGVLGPCPKLRGQRSAAKLTLAQLDEIWRAAGSQTEISERFGISQSHVSRIKRGELVTQPHKMENAA